MRAHGRRLFRFRPSLSYLGTIPLRSDGVATLQICYKDSTGRVVCKDSTVQRMMASPDQKEGDKPNKRDVKAAIDQLTELLLTETPDYFAFVYAPDGVEASAAPSTQSQ